MRVIAGEYRSRKLKSVPGVDVRPTPDRMRETLFNILAPKLEGVVFLDAYAGTGAVGIEALSRGAARAILVETNKAALQVIHENLASLGLLGRAEVVRGKAVAALTRCQADIVFLDPPYDRPKEYTESLELLGTKPPSLLVIAQHAAQQKIEPAYGRMSAVRTVRQGDNVLTFFAPQDLVSEPEPAKI